MKSLRVILLTALICWAVSLAPAQDTDPTPELRLAPGLIVDNADAAGVVINGKWIPVKGSPKQRHGPDFLFIKGGQPDTDITFTPALPKDGEYTVFVRYLTMSGCSRRVPVTVRHADGESAHTLDQRDGAGKWHELGTFNFTVAEGGEVRIDAAAADGLVTADAVMFSRLVTVAELQAIKDAQRDLEREEKQAELDERRRRGLSGVETVRRTTSVGEPAEPVTPPEVLAQEYYRDPKTLESIRQRAEARLAKTKELTGAELTLYETDHFLIYTDINAKTASQVSVFAERLEKVLRNPFDVPAEQFLWPGKLVVWVFKNRKDYDVVRVEIDNFVAEKDDASRFRGYAQHAYGTDGVDQGKLLVHINISYETPKEVVGGERTSFFNTFAHETTHAFTASWPKRGRVPTWFNEGLAEFAAGEAVSEANAASRRQRAYRQVRDTPGAVVPMMADDRRFLSGGNDGTIDEYGIAQSLVRYLYLAKKEGLFTCYHLLKQGKGTEASLKEAFGVTTREFVELWCSKARRLPGGP